MTGRARPWGLPWGLGLAALVLVLMALSAGLRARAPLEHRETVYVFGTLVEIVVRGTDAETAARATADAGRLLQQLHTHWHAWRPGALSDVSAAFAAGQDASISAELAAVLELGRRLSCESGGHFDPAIGRLIALWGFHADTPLQGRIPDPEAIADLQARQPRMSDVRIAGNLASSRNPSVHLDLGAYGKGAALDRVEAVLREHGIQNAILNAGGDVNVMGQHGSRPWRVAIRDPFVWGVVAGIRMRAGEVLYTSGNYERFIAAGETRFAHILDPRTGYPVQEIVSVSVLHTNGARADAAATALSVAGPEGWAQVAATMGIEAALLITSDGTLLATDAMADRLEMQDQGAEVQRVPLPPAQDVAQCHAPRDGAGAGKSVL